MEAGVRGTALLTQVRAPTTPGAAQTKQEAAPAPNSSLSKHTVAEGGYPFYSQGPGRSRRESNPGLRHLNPRPLPLQGSEGCWQQSCSQRGPAGAYGAEAASPAATHMTPADEIGFLTPNWIAKGC